MCCLHSLFCGGIFIVFWLGTIKKSPLRGLRGILTTTFLIFKEYQKYRGTLYIICKNLSILICYLSLYLVRQVFYQRHALHLHTGFFEPFYTLPQSFYTGHSYSASQNSSKIALYSCICSIVSAESFSPE